MSIINFFKCGSQRYESALLNDITKLDFELGLKDPHEGCNTITNSFNHAPLKKKTTITDAPFTNK